MTGQTITVDGHRIALSNLDKCFFPDAGLTKGDLVDYYRRIAPVALAHYRDRPLTMQRFPDGIAEEGFFQKQAGGYFPNWVQRVRLPKEDGHVDYVVADRAATLVYLANQACITPHLGLARCARPYHPDRLIFDLDPSDDDFEKVRFAARQLKTTLDALSLESFVQTTGSRGLHVLVPLDGSAHFDDVRDFARRLAERLADEHPDRLTTKTRKAQRGNAIFIDYLRNAYGQTAVAPYAVRAIEDAPVATPLDWSEVADRELHPRRYTIGNLFRRLGQREDPWAGLEARGQSLAPALEQLDAAT